MAGHNPRRSGMTNQTESSPISPRFETIDGLRIRYATSEKESGEPVLLLSPWPESIYAFLPIWNLLASTSRLIAIDLPGFGHSEGRPDVIAPEPMGEFVIKVLQEFGLESPHGLGPDVGTSPLLYAASNHPGSFRSLIVGSGATNHRDLGGILKEMVEAPSIEPFKNVVPEDFVRGAIGNLKNYKPPEYVIQDYIASYAGDRYIESMRFVRAYPQALPRLSERLSRIKIPVQIIAGRFDPFVPVSNAEGLHRDLPKSKLDVLECGHFAWEDEAANYGRIASDWIRGGYLRLESGERARA
jgi:pimeloyl-ACP methyl ester carboxylesterase